MFGLDAYEKVIDDLLKKGYIFTDFLSDLNKNSICLRHDVDVSVEAAYKIALIEKDIGIKANYFFMLTSYSYNSLSDDNRSLIKKIHELGHAISLHFDPSIYSDIDNYFVKEKELFENIFDVNINFVSIHRPRDFLKDNNRKLKDCYHSYEDRFFKNMLYLADSAGRDIRSDLKNLLTGKNINPIHLLIHPIWWTTKTLSCTDTLNNWLEENNDFLTSQIRLNHRTYRKS